jgi:O-antigen/teichoic acid export membrane protein
MSEIEARVRRGTAWVGLAAAAVGALDVVALVVMLRRWVTAEELGVATLAVALFPVLELLADCGLVTALVQRHETDEPTLSGVFWLNILFALGLLAVLAVVGPLFGRFHGHPVVGQLLIGYGVKLVLQSTWTIPNALLKRELRFKELALIRIGANLGDLAGKVGFAAAGHPIWCFVAGQLCHAVIYTVAVHAVRRWRPGLALRPRAVLGHFRFGAQATSAQLLFQFYSNFDYQVVGHVFGATALGIYRVAYDLVLYPVHFLSGITTDVALPAFARLRLESSRLVAQFLAFARQNLLLTLPAVVLVLVEADDLLVTFFPRCTGGAAVARVLCLVGLLRSMSLLFPPLLDGLGRPGAYLRVAALTAAVMPIAFVVAALTAGQSLGMMAVALAWAAVYPLAFAVLARLGLSLMGLPIGDYLRRAGAVVAMAAGTLLPALVLRWAGTGWAPATRLVAVAAALAILFVRPALGRRPGLAGGSA